MAKVKFVKKDPSKKVIGKVKLVKKKASPKQKGTKYA